METETQLIWTQPAINDLQKIYENYVQFSNTVADNLIDRILNKAEKLSISGFALMGAVDSINSNYRIKIEGNYKILYTAIENQIYINRIFDYRQDPQKLKKY